MYHESLADMAGRRRYIDSRFMLANAAKEWKFYTVGLLRNQYPLRNNQSDATSIWRASRMNPRVSVSVLLLSNNCLIMRRGTRPALRQASTTNLPVVKLAY
jgi:hypothetical protein